MNDKLQSILDQAVGSLSEALGDNLYSCCVYGSVVRGNFIAGVSDINLLIVLNESNPAAHQAVARVVGGNWQIDPFVLARRGFQRSARAFASKFASIKRNYRVLRGADPLADVQVEPGLEKFLCEQALRNLRLRLVYTFVTRQQSKVYDKFLARCVTPLFTQMSEAVRLNGVVVPKEFETRIGLFEKEFQIDGAALRDLLAFKKAPQKLSDEENIAWHQRIFPVVDAVITWIERAWTS